MAYADLVIGAIVAVFPVAISVLVALGYDVGSALLVGSLMAMTVMFHAMFVNPPGDRTPE